MVGSRFMSALLGSATVAVLPIFALVSNLFLSGFPTPCPASGNPRFTLVDSLTVSAILAVANDEVRSIMAGGYSAPWGGEVGGDEESEGERSEDVGERELSPEALGKPSPGTTRARRDLSELAPGRGRRARVPAAAAAADDAGEARPPKVFEHTALPRQSSTNLRRTQMARTTSRPGLVPQADFRIAVFIGRGIHRTISRENPGE